MNTHPLSNPIAAAFGLGLVLFCPRGEAGEAIGPLPLPPAVSRGSEKGLEPVVSGNLVRGRPAYIDALTRAAQLHGIPPAVADAVVSVESGYDPSVVGGVGEIGLMQVRPSTAELLGFRGSTAKLAEPQTNIELGVAYLAKAWRLAGGDLCRALMKYRAGHGEERMSALSHEYCRRARVHLAAIGSDLANQKLPQTRSDTGDAAPRRFTSVSRGPALGRPASWPAAKAERLFAASRSLAEKARARVSVMQRRNELWAAHRASPARRERS